MSDRDLKAITGKPDDVRIVIVARADGLFHYRQDVFYPPVPEEGQRGGWISQTANSGIFPTPEAAEQEAHRSIPWLRNQISN